MAQRKLTEKQNLFVSEYVIDFNARDAAIRAGYSKNTAHVIANQLLNKTLISSTIKQCLINREKRTQITADRVLNEIAKISFFDPRKLFNEDGSPKPIKELDDDTAGAICGLEVVMVGNSEVGIGQVLKYKLADKNSALDKLCKHLALYADKNVNIKGKIDVEHVVRKVELIAKDVPRETIELDRSQYFESDHAKKLSS